VWDYVFTYVENKIPCYTTINLKLVQLMQFNKWKQILLVKSLNLFIVVTDVTSLLQKCHKKST